MVIRKFHWNFWSKILLGISLIASGLFYLGYEGSKKEIASLKDEIIRLYKEKGYVSTSPNFKSINVKYRGDVYPILETENFLDVITLDLSYNDTLLIDSVSFDRIKDAIVIPQPIVDSVYRQEGVKSLIERYFKGKIPKIFFEYNDVDSIPSNQSMELNYVMTILLREGFILFRDCESGIPMLLITDKNL